MHIGCGLVRRCKVVQYGFSEGVHGVRGRTNGHFLVKVGGRRSQLSNSRPGRSHGILLPQQEPFYYYSMSDMYLVYVPLNAMHRQFWLDRTTNGTYSMSSRTEAGPVGRAEYFRTPGIVDIQGSSMQFVQTMTKGSDSQHMARSIADEGVVHLTQCNACCLLRRWSILLSRPA